MSVTTPCLSISTVFPLRLQPHKPSSTLSFHPTTTIKLPKPKTPIPISSSLAPHSLQFRLSAASYDNLQDTQSDDFYDDDEEELEEEEEEEEVDSSKGSRLYVGNLPYVMTSSELTDIFSEAGRVVSVEIVYDRVTDRSRGFAFVTMLSVDEAKEAIRMYNGAQIGGRTVKVNFPEVPLGGEREVMGPRIRSSYRGFIDSPFKIYAGNLSWNITSQGLRDVFDEQPGLLSAKVIYERDSGRSRGYGFVTFSSMNEAQMALNTLNGVEVEGRPLRLNLATVKAASSDTPPRETKLEAGPDDSDNVVQSTVAML